MPFDSLAETADSAVEPLVAAFRHDVHKLRSRGHKAAAETYAGVRVNETVPHGADQDAALLSRPSGAPGQTVAAHQSPYRLSLVTGTPAREARQLPATDGEFEALVTPEDPATLHAAWLTSPVAAGFNESVYYPYTSLRAHVLLVAALLDNYQSGHAFDDFSLVATEPGATEQQNLTTEAALASDVVKPCRTVLWSPVLALHLTGDPGDRPAATLGDVPAQSFADVWSRLSAHPIDQDSTRRWRRLDAQLRRIRSWSTALAYLNDYVAVYGGDRQ
ncbi:hypothetical protein ACFQL1_16140 [Halomicroarcula sp. GCM10025709]|uniref:hypothetical protein n=1 Tax=Haloarcula TaxID=2237 RepID=UPI0024C30C24|nr:hypothetical protein [Halomicroarcula sp. YJ-61-S]